MPLQDLREYITRLEQEDELRHVEPEVDWDLELGAVSRRGIELRGPALLFEKIKDYPQGYRILANSMSGSRPIYARLAIAMGLPKDTPIPELIDRYAEGVQDRIKPVVVSAGPCKEIIRKGDDVDILDFPIPLLHGNDGGRYAGTWHVDINRDPDTGWVNWGMYRHMVHDAKTLGWLASPYQHGPNIYYQKYEARNKPMPMAIAIGPEPVSALVASTGFPAQITEADIVGGLRKAPIELVKCETIDLEVPATSEIVLEGMVYPGDRKMEGGFGEYTGYDAGGKGERAVFHIQCITHRKDPILTVCNPGKGWDELDVVHGISSSAMLKNDLKRLGLPVKAVYAMPPLSVVVSVKPQYMGYAHTIAGAVWASKSGVSRAYVFVVGDDVDVTNPEDLLWCLTTRLHPARSIHVQPWAPVSPLTPFMSKEDKVKGSGARVMFDATFPYNWSDEERPTVIDLEHGWPKDIQDKVLSRWQEYGI